MLTTPAFSCLSGLRDGGLVPSRLAGTGSAMRAVMHALLFAAKRTFHKSNGWARRHLRQFEITPSRFDVLYVLHERGVPIWQSTIRTILGVTRSTTHLFLVALEELGLVVRTRSDADRRQLDVQLTAAGIELFDEIRQALLPWSFGGTQIIHDGLVRFLACPTDSALREQERIAELEETLARMRRRMGDYARLVYSWGLDD